MIIQAQLSQCNTGIWTLKILKKYEVLSVAHAKKERCTCLWQVSQCIVCHFCLMVSTIKRLLQLCLILQLCQEVHGIISVEVI